MGTLGTLLGVAGLGYADRNWIDYAMLLSGLIWFGLALRLRQQRREGEER
jgi:hypothetical protein